MHAEFLSWSGLPDAYLPVLERDWAVRPLTIDGEVAAVGVVNGTEIHFAVAPAMRGRVITRARCAEYLGPMLEERGFLSTRVHRSSSAKFVERLGFVKTREDDFVHYYMLTGIPFARTEN